MVPWLLGQVLNVNTEWKELKSSEKANMTDLKKHSLFSICTVHKFKWNQGIVQSNFNQRQKQNPQNFKPLL